MDAMSSSSLESVINFRLEELTLKRDQAIAALDRTREQGENLSRALCTIDGAIGELTRLKGGKGQDMTSKYEAEPDPSHGDDI
jgi:hypothetical protein